MGDVDAQSDDTESNQDFGIGGVDPSGDSDFNDIYYQCRYERYAAFSRANLLNEVLSLCANIDRLQYEKSEVEKRLRDVQQHLYEVTSAHNGNQNRSTNDEGNQVNDDDSRVRTRTLVCRDDCTFLLFLDAISDSRSTTKRFQERRGYNSSR